MDKKQNAAETVYRLSVVVLDTLLMKHALSSEEYDRLRRHLAEDTSAPIGLLESENMLWFARISLVCFDEAHLLGDAHRGATLELLTAFLRSLKTKLRIILMSATISNADELAEWLAPCGVISNVPRYPKLDKWVYGTSRYN